MQGERNFNRRLFTALAAVLLLAALVAALSLNGTTRAAAEPRAQASAIKTKSFNVTQVDNRIRYEVLCPKGKYPLGGGISSSPGPTTGGEGIYPNSYERLGAQAGYHVTAALVDLVGGNTGNQQLTLQVVCVGDKPGKITPPHKTVFVQPGETKELTIKCPGKRHLLGGGYQRTTFVSNGGNRITESRAVSSKAWKVVATAASGFGGELTGIAYCVRSKKPILKEVTASVDLVPQAPGSVTTPRCPKGRILGFAGFATPSTDRLVYMGSSINSGNTSTASGFNDGSTSTSAVTSKLTAYGYCIKK